MSNGIIYLLHFEQPIGNDRKFAQHYIGYCNKRGIDFQLVRTWRGGRAEERRLKTIGKSNHLCPLCDPKSKRGKKVKPRTKPSVPATAREEFESLCF